MSISYTLYLTQTPSLTLQDREHVWVVQGPVGEPTATYVEEDYGLRPAQSIRFRHDKWNTFEARCEMAAQVSEILRSTQGDALLLQNGELPVLRRTGERIVVSTRSALSYPDEIGFLGLPVEIDDLGDVP